jgi:hypothetical protein
MDDIYRDPYRPVVAVHVDQQQVSIVFLSDGRVLWLGVLPVDTSQATSDWRELNRTCAYLFPKVERIVIDNRPFAFLMNLFSEFKEHQWKCVFITGDLLRYKFLRPLDEGAVVRFAEDWLRASHTAPELVQKLQAHSERVHLCLALLCYMTFVSPTKHELSNYRPSKLLEC